MPAKIGHIILNVSNWKISEPFYDTLMDAMGFTIDHIHNAEATVLKSYMLGDHNLWIRCDFGSQSEEFIRDAGLDHLAFKVDTNQEVDRLFETVKKMKGTISHPPQKYPDYTDTYYAFYFRDPDNIPLEVYRQ